MSVDAEVADYINAINGSDVIKGRVLSLIPLLEKLLLPEKQPINSAFVSEYIDSNGSRTYESLWFFSATFALEAHAFLTVDVFDIIKFESNVGYIRTDISGYMPPEGTTPESRMSVNLSFRSSAAPIYGGGTHYGTLKATGANCRYLNDITRRIFVANLAPGSYSASVSVLLLVTG